MPVFNLDIYRTTGDIEAARVLKIPKGLVVFDKMSWENFEDYPVESGQTYFLFAKKEGFIRIFVIAPVIAGEPAVFKLCFLGQREECTDYFRAPVEGLDRTIDVSVVDLLFSESLDELTFLVAEPYDRALITEAVEFGKQHINPILETEIPTEDFPGDVGC